MKKAIAVLLALVMIYLMGCVSEVATKHPTTKKILPDSQLQLLYSYPPYYAKDRLPNSELQDLAYKKAHQRTQQFGHWLGGFFLGSPYAILTSFQTADPPLVDFQTIPADSSYWYARYYGQEVRRIRSFNAWFGTGTAAAVGTTIWVIYIVSVRNSLRDLGY